MNIRLDSDRNCDGSKMYKNVILAAFFVTVLLGLTDGNCKGFECRNGICIPQDYMCDKHDDCGDGSDEIYCGNCKVDDFRCLNGKCIPRGDFCDDVNDCGDNSDEEFCDISNGTIVCPTSWLLCKSRKQCYPSSFKCDDINDCLDSSDENSCEFEIKSISGAVGVENNLTRYLLDIRRSTRSVNRWGPHFTRIAMALFLRDTNFFASSNSTGEEFAYELTIQLLTKLALKKKISTHELSLLVNAMIVSCINPREFFGVDMVAELRKRVNSTNNTNPFAILTLCNAKDLMTFEDVIRLQQRFDANLRPLWTDTRAIVAMAMACVAKQPHTYVDQEVIKNMVEKIIQSQDKNDNLKTTALVMQALIATGTYKSKYNWVAAVEYILKEMKPSRVNLQDVYYILPIFSLKSLANISSDHCRTRIKTGSMNIAD